MAFRFSDPENALAQIGELAAGYGIGGAVSTALEPLLQNLRSELWALDASLPTDAQTIALLARLQRIDIGAAEAIAEKSGVAGDSLAHYIDATKTPPGTSELMEMRRRGSLTDIELRQLLELGGLDERTIDQYLALLRVHLTPDEAANARQQGFATAEEARAIAALWGIEPQDADIQFELAGLPPGPEQMIDLWRRGEIDEDRVRTSIVEGHIKLKYVDDVLKLRYMPLSASIAAEALIRQRIPQEEAIAIAEKNGIKPDDFLLWSNMLGRPIATGEALTLARRGEFTFDQFTEAVARSDVRTEYAPDMWKLRRAIPPLFQLVRLHDGGKIDDALFGKLLSDLGYDADLVAALAHAGKTAQTVRTHHLTATQIDEIYQAGLESEAWAMTQLKALGYDEDSARWHLSILWAQMLTQAKEAAIRRIRSLYVTWKIGATEMQADLDATGITATAKEAFIESWNHERAENRPTLTTADIRASFKWGRFDYATAFARLVALGHSDDDALTLLWVTHHGDPRPTA